MMTATVASWLHRPHLLLMLSEQLLFHAGTLVRYISKSSLKVPMQTKDTFFLSWYKWDTSISRLNSIKKSLRVYPSPFWMQLIEAINAFVFNFNLISPHICITVTYNSRCFKPSRLDFFCCYLLIYGAIQLEYLVLHKKKSAKCHR